MPSRGADQGFGVFVASGGDRVGLLNQVSEFVTAHGANIERATVDTAAGQCVVFALVAGKNDQLELFQQNLSELEAKTGLSTTFNIVFEPSVPEGRRGVQWVIKLAGEDYPGLLRDATRQLVKDGMSVVHYDGRRYFVDIGRGGFTQEFKCDVPTDWDRPKFMADLQALADAKGFYIVYCRPA